MIVYDQLYSPKVDVITKYRIRENICHFESSKRGTTEVKT